jgi:hypothetical protein
MRGAITWTREFSADWHALAFNLSAWMLVIAGGCYLLVRMTRKPH